MAPRGDATGGFDTEVAVHETTIRAHGEIDLTVSPKLTVAGREAVWSGTPAICIDLRDVSFMDSSGLSALINLHRTATNRGIGFRVLCGEGITRRLFALTRTERLLGVE